VHGVFSVQKDGYPLLLARVALILALESILIAYHLDPSSLPTIPVDAPTAETEWRHCNRTLGKNSKCDQRIVCKKAQLDLVS
tara:strand:- start:868 stop:1113 length:246 start_codon:yes stop_codon:yes gene_type:complete